MGVSATPAAVNSPASEDGKRRSDGTKSSERASRGKGGETLPLNPGEPRETTEKDVYCPAPPLSLSSHCTTPVFPGTLGLFKRRLSVESQIFAVSYAIRSFELELVTEARWFRAPSLRSLGAIF
ncbi:unnamed protein product [Pleuronectes platessa]|uniref:Uncharacterized protein n=1 Tax=Pleuronectes platessa TaxID=8262 RepID=A0A9N7VQ16_PLEPL|nr:unnamed protein product [Pleuronectes platessa]